MSTGAYSGWIKEVFPEARGPQAHHEYTALCPHHDDHHPSLCINATTGLWKCMACGESGNAPQLAAKLGVRLPGELLGTNVGNSKRKKRSQDDNVVARYSYQGPNRETLYRTCRYEPGPKGRSKGFFQERPDGQGGWIRNMEGVRRVLYRLPELLDAPPEQLVLVLEGEKHADAAAALGFLATSNVGGAGKWRPEYNETLRGCHVVILPDNDAPGKDHAGVVASSLHGIAASLRIRDLPDLPPKGDLMDWLAAGGTGDALRRLIEATPVLSDADLVALRPPLRKKTGAGGEHLTDVGNARRLAAHHGSDLRYCHPWKCWLAWDGARWRRDDSGEVERRAKRTVARIYEEASADPDDNRRRAIAQHAARSETRQRVEAMIRLARSEPSIPIVPHDLDRDPWLLNVKNGTLDLRTGELRRHQRHDLITKQTPTVYDEDAPCPTWERFLARIFDGQREVIEFLRRAIGYSLTGETTEQCLFLLHGSGANGKSTLLETLSDLLGDYAATTPPETFLARYGQHIPNDLARLEGVRFVSSSEIAEGRRLAENLVKVLTGGDTVAARFLHAEFFEFRPQFKLWVASNHRPEIRGTDHAVWRRIRLLPFSVSIPLKEQDRRLRNKLRAELPGILAWAVRGCLAWRQEGLGEPHQVLRATGNYRLEMDTLGHFLAECCLQRDDGRVVAAVLYVAYQDWCAANGEAPVTQRKFGQSLSERGFAPGKLAGKRAWFGLGLLATEEQEALSCSHRLDALDGTLGVFQQDHPHIVKTSKQASNPSNASSDGSCADVDESPDRVPEPADTPDTLSRRERPSPTTQAAGTRGAVPEASPPEENCADEEEGVTAGEGMAEEESVVEEVIDF